MLDDLPSASSLALAFWSPQLMWQGCIGPNYPTSEIDGTSPGAKPVSQVQRFMLPFKIRPIPVHKEKIDCWACFVLEKNQSWFLPMIPLLSGWRGAPFLTPHCLLISAVLSCISIGSCLGLRLKPPFTFPSLLSILRSLLLFPKITVSV